jgi:choline dehydrogenase-like flavoprotein
VWYVQFGVKKFARVSKEVIVSGGAVDSPKILMLSGIGPKKHLTSVGIKTRADLPVGQNLQDHLAVMIANVVMDEPISFIPERDFDLSVAADYFFNGKGVITSPTAVQGQAFISTSEVKKTGIDWPDIQLYLFGVGNFAALPKDFHGAFGFNYDMLEKFTKNSIGKDGFILMPTLVRPKSVGEILLKDKNPFTPPIIDPHYLEHPQDVKALVEGLQLCTKIIDKTQAFKKAGAKLLDNPLPGCEKEVFRSDKYWECYARMVSMTLYHPVGTCRMGKGVNDPKAVLDSKLRVLKTTGLRVADASIMVDIINGNTNAPSIMIGEKASQIIREYWSEQYLISPNFSRTFDKNWTKKCFYSRMV